MKIVGHEKFSGALIISTYDKKTQDFEMEICAPKEFHCFHEELIELFNTGIVSDNLKNFVAKKDEGYIMPNFLNEKGHSTHLYSVKHTVADTGAENSEYILEENPLFHIEKPVLHQGPWLTRESKDGVKKHLFSYGGSAFLILDKPNLTPTIYLASAADYFKHLAKTKKEDFHKCALDWAKDVSKKGTVEERNKYDFSYQRLRVYIQIKVNDQRKEQQEEQPTSGKTNELSSEGSAVEGASSQAAEESSVLELNADAPDSFFSSTHFSHNQPHQEPQYQVHPPPSLVSNFNVYQLFPQLPCREVTFLDQIRKRGFCKVP
eukprot:GHVP01059948.1.p1 GENE.GHVP01059948.1~~GHVP01059948.1.p1  ORF type:complete len:319 (-),score=48.25 GHVP01059948.1:189-1145(-)